MTQEAERVMDTYEQHLHLPVTKIDDAERMLGLLKVCAPVPVLALIFFKSSLWGSLQDRCASLAPVHA